MQHCSKQTLMFSVFRGWPPATPRRDLLSSDHTVTLVSASFDLAIFFMGVFRTAETAVETEEDHGAIRRTEIVARVDAYLERGPSVSWISECFASGSLSG